MTEAVILQRSKKMDEHSYAPLMDHEKVTNKYGGHFVGHFPAKTKHGWSADIAVAVYYHEVPNPPHTNKYYGFFIDSYERMNICNADYVEGEIFAAIDTADGIIYSTCRHDYRSYGDSTVDGGWDMFHGGGTNLISVRVMNGQFEKVETEDESASD